MDEIISIINSVGFPIVACFYMAKREEKLTEIINEVCITLKGIDTRLENVERELEKNE